MNHHHRHRIMSPAQQASHDSFLSLVEGLSMCVRRHFENELTGPTLIHIWVFWLRQATTEQHYHWIVCIWSSLFTSGKKDFWPDKVTEGQQCYLVYPRLWPHWCNMAQTLQKAFQIGLERLTTWETRRDFKEETLLLFKLSPVESWFILRFGNILI